MVERPSGRSTNQENERFALTYAIRRAVPADAERVADIARRTFTETFGHLYQPEDLAYFLDTSYISATQRELLEDCLLYTSRCV